jgi:hypothetical protein
MRTTLDLPEDLVLRAMNVCHSKNKKAVIILALEELIRKKELSGIRKYRGKIDLDIYLDELRNRT